MSPHKRVIDECQSRLNQELKNYQTEIYQMNQSIQELKAMVLALNKKQDDQMAKIQSQYKASEILNEHFTEYVKEEVAECKDILDGYRNELKNVNGLAREAIDQCFNYVPRSTFYAHHDSVNATFKEHQVRIDGVKAEVDGMCNRYTLVNHSFAKELKSFTEMLPNLQPLRDYIDQKFVENSVNFSGVVREIEICKNRISYGDKKFENLYTLIERLKGKE